MNNEGINLKAKTPLKFSTTTLVDQVEEKLLEYIRDNRLTPGDTLPNETLLSENMGISRNVIREAMSRLRMLGIIQSRTKKGITVVEPPLLTGLEKVTNPYLFSIRTIQDIMEMRIALEIGIVDFIFNNCTADDIDDLKKIVEQGQTYEDNHWPVELEKAFHQRIYEIAGNPFITQFQNIVHIIFEFAKTHYDSLFKPINETLKKQGKLVTHEDLYLFIRNGDRAGYSQAIKGHLSLYLDFMKKAEDTEDRTDN
ncbi:FadR/GntR family transcriptional regulator [Sinomicrobium soli]|uniref:FadR/GntR family transcriptional regulator n=1 Tax=Sinomicrobium sp. N-1-3-6 TaxID=2219864 RepID=UPI000DCECCF8|nr:FadR/GntR family transcriptional regulator [Sinomicrobium sp. N-1-3-6]RAV29539.1 FadR family transcriptional regulator [Sinomicrobium sp. N-1-3-6]